MRIEDIDSNFKVENDFEEEDIVWFNAKDLPFTLYGVYHDVQEGYLRMPKDFAFSVTTGLLKFLYNKTAGGRVKFRTNSSFIGIKTEMEFSPLITNLSRVGQSGFDLYYDKDGEELFHSTFIMPLEYTDGWSASCKTDGEYHEYTIYMPTYDKVKNLYIALKKDAILDKTQGYSKSGTVLYYGSSITQGGCASRPGNCYPALISQWLQVDHINFGFCGNCKGEVAVAEYIASLPMSIFVCDYDYNAIGLENLEKTHLPFYRAFRKKKPDVPIIFISAPDVRYRPEKEVRREVIRKTYKTALSEGDNNVYFIDGGELFDGRGWRSCTVDGCHPNDLGFYRMAERIAKEIEPLL